MVTAAAIGWSTTYEIWDASLTTPAFAFVAEVNSVTPGAAEVDRIDATHMQSPNRRREYIAGLIDNGEASFEMNFVPGSASDVLIRGLLDSGASVQHRITFPNGHRVTYNAVILSSTGISFS